MSIIHEYPDHDLQIWNNDSCSKFQSFDVNFSESSESNSSKENQSPVRIKPLHPKNSIESPQIKSNKIVQKRGNEAIKIDLEIQELEKELDRLSLRLHSLRIEKLGKKTKMAEPKGTIFKLVMINKQRNQSSADVENSGFSNKIDEKTTFSKSVRKRGVSMCPSDIMPDSSSRRLSNVLHTTTPVSKQSRRKSCYWKLDKIDELKVTKEKGGNRISSISPKSRKTGSKAREDGVSALVNPKKLFNVEKSDLDKKNNALKVGKVVASRYNKDGKIDENASELRALRGMVSRVKKRWEIPSEIVICKERSSSIDSEFNEKLPRIKIVRCAKSSPRDSGGVKRVADLVGKKSYFESSFGQALNFEDDDEEIVYTGKAEKGVLDTLKI